MIIKFEAIKKLVERNSDQRYCSYQGHCHCCHSNIKIEIKKTSGGYGLKGGVMYEQYVDEIILICDECFKKSNEPYHDYIRAN
jgi:hypothetical protein